MSYDSNQDWQMMSPAWRDEQIHKCLCTLKTNLASYFEGQPLVYRALLTQTGSGIPTAVVLENTLGEVPTFGYVGGGDYTMDTVSNVFTSNKTFVLFTGGVADPSRAQFVGYKLSSENSISLFSIDNGAQGDDVMSSASIQILVYP